VKRQLFLMESIPMTGIAVVLHERLGTWAAQLRPRLQDPRIRWIESRSTADLASAIEGLARPIVLIDLGTDAIPGLSDLERLREQSPGARVLVLDLAEHEGVADFARELGATCVRSGFVPPPEVAQLLERWIALAVDQTAREGWSRPLPAHSPGDVEFWFALATTEENSPTGRWP
jgi:DNA-binding NarL/FixJ family response regulator